MAYDNPKVFEEPQSGKDAGALWHRRIQHAIKWRQKHPYADKQWKRNLELDRGLHWEEDHRSEHASSTTPRERITVNITGSYVRDFIAFLFKHTPEFLAKARTAQAVRSARLQQALVNYFWREKRWKKQAKRGVQDLIKLGVGVVRTGWVTEIDESATPDDHGRVEYHDAVKRDEPIVRRVSPARFIIDPHAAEHDLESARWVAEVFHKPLNDVLVNVRYNEKVLEKIRTCEYTPKIVSKEDDEEQKQLALPMGESLLDGEGGSTKLVRVYDVWDKKFQNHFQLLDGVPEPLVEEKWPYPYLDGFPYVMAVFDETNDELYGTGLPWAMEDQQLELNRIRTTEFQHRRAFGRVRHQILKNGLDEDQRIKLQNGDDGDILVNTHEAVKPLLVPNLPPDNYKVEEIIKEDIRQLTGADQLTSGGGLPSRTSATEINARSNYTGMKIEMRVDVVDEFLTDITRQVLQHMRANLSTPQAVRIQGADGAIWEEVSRDLIQEEVDLEITTVSAERNDKNMARQQAIQVMQHLLTNAPALLQFGYVVNVPRLLEFVLREHFEVREYDDFVFQGMPNPFAAVMPGAGGVPAGGPVGIPPAQQNAQIGAVQPGSIALGGAMGALGG